MPTLTRHAALVLAVAALTASPSLAGPQLPKSVPERARASERVVVATVAAVEAAYQTNEFGDRLIVSRVHLTVDEPMKGGAVRALEMDLEGGTVGEITMTVSDLPALKKGERAVFFLARGRAGRLVPHMRGQSILKLDARQKVAGTNVDLAEVRTMVLGVQ